MAYRWLTRGDIASSKRLFTNGDAFSEADLSGEPITLIDDSIGRSERTI